MKTEEYDITITDGTITAKTLCEITTLTDQRHRQLAQAGYFPTPKRGLYQFKPTIQGLLRYLRERNDKAALSDLRLKKLRAQCQLVE